MLSSRNPVDAAHPRATTWFSYAYYASKPIISNVNNFARFSDIFFFLKKFYAYETPRNPLRIHDGYSGKLFSIV